MMKLFVIADQSLSKRQQFVQGAHAIAQYQMDHPNSGWLNGTLVMLKAKDVGEWAHMLWDKGIKFSKFSDPYYGEDITAISALNIGDLVANLKLI